jgi:hypothetical protein
MGELSVEPDFRGCAFYNASAEGPREETAVSRIGAEQRAWTRGLFTELARDVGATDPQHLAQQLVVLYDGTMVGASMDRGPAAARVAREVAAGLLDAAVPARPSKRRAPRR